MPRSTQNILKNIDWVTIFIFLLLIFFGWMNIYATVYNEKHHLFFDFSQRYGKQMIWIGVSIFLAIFIIGIDSRFFPIFAYYIYGLTLFLLFLVFIFARDVNGARAWFEWNGIKFQPSEFTKLATTLAIAKYLNNFAFSQKSFRDWVIIGGIILLPALLIVLQHDTGTAIVFVSLIFALYREGLSGNILLLILYLIILFIFSLLYDAFYISFILPIFFFALYSLYFRNVKKSFFAIIIFAIFFGILFGIKFLWKKNFEWHAILSITSILTGVILFIWAFQNHLRNISVWCIVFVGSVFFSYSVDYLFNNVLEKHQRTRINVLFGVEQDLQGAGYNVNQSKIAIGSGGWVGKGWCQGTQTKFDFVPEQTTDFIFCTIGEEWGFLGTTIIIILFITLLLRLIYLAERQTSIFSRVFGYGVVSILFLHFAINIGMTIGLAPVVGIPLPFISYGGSSLWGFTLLLFIFIRLDINRKELL